MQISSDREGPSRILQELLANASKYAAPDSQLHLTLAQSTPLADTLTISLCNTGVGITEEEMAHIFDKFRRGQSATPNAVPGTGLGLALVQRLVQLLKGQITATSYPMQNSLYQTCFTLTLPQQWQTAES
jgi:signal transduction histidine kinase